MTVLEIYGLLDAAAHFETQEEYDNSGFLAGSASCQVTGILFALDVTEKVIDEAMSLGANLIVTHHPLMFNARRTLTDGDYEGRLLMRLIRENISLIAAHTCLDKADGGINDTLAEMCSLLDIRGQDFVRVGRLPRPMTSGELTGYLSVALNTTVRLMGDEDRRVEWLGLCSGAGGSEWQAAAALGAEAFLSGEIKHNLALEMADAGIPAYECGHFATEEPGIFALADALQSALNRVQYKLGIFKSETAAYSFPSQP